VRETGGLEPHLGGYTSAPTHAPPLSPRSPPSLGASAPLAGAALTAALFFCWRVCGGCADVWGGIGMVGGGRTGLTWVSRRVVAVGERVLARGRGSGCEGLGVRGARMAGRGRGVPRLAAAASGMRRVCVDLQLGGESLGSPGEGDAGERARPQRPRTDVGWWGGGKRSPKVAHPLSHTRAHAVIARPCSSMQAHATAGAHTFIRIRCKPHGPPTPACVCGRGGDAGSAGARPGKAGHTWRGVGDGETARPRTPHRSPPLPLTRVLSALPAPRAARRRRLPCTTPPITVTRRSRRRWSRREATSAPRT
jgi:hypothetical protein